VVRADTGMMTGKGTTDEKEIQILNLMHNESRNKIVTLLELGLAKFSWTIRFGC